jgi:hypothetical protein
VDQCWAERPQAGPTSGGNKWKGNGLHKKFWAKSIISGKRAAEFFSQFESRFLGLKIKCFKYFQTKFEWEPN